MKLILVFLLTFNCITAFSQFSFSRIEADFSIKEKKNDGTMSLTMGKVFFDLNERQIVYQITFPVKEILLMKDSVTYQIVDGVVKSQHFTGILIDFSIFNLALQGELPHFGIKNTPFKLEKTEVNQGMVLSTWIPPKRLQELQGKVMISQKNKQLFGMVSFSSKEEVIAKQFFRKYQNFQGVQFPTEVLNFTYFKGSENKKITTYRNVQINNFTTDIYYDYQLPNK